MSSVPTGSVWAMGRNHRGQLGLGAEDRDQHPTAMQLAGSGGVVQVAAGMYFSAALTASGEVFLWGWNQFGQVGDGTMEDRPAPTRVTALGTDTVQLALGSSHSLALKQGGEVFSWGHGSDSQLGLGDTDSRVSPTQMDLGSDNALIAAQSTGGMALKADGRLFNWGYVCCTHSGEKSALAYLPCTRAERPEPARRRLPAVLWTVQPPRYKETNHFCFGAFLSGLLMFNSTGAPGHGGQRQRARGGRGQPRAAAQDGR